MKKEEKYKIKKIFKEMKDGNKDIIEKLYLEYNRIIYSIAFSILKKREDSEDIVQIVFSKIYEMDVNKLPEEKEISWLYTITKNETINFLRKNKDNIYLENLYEIKDTDDELNKIIERDSYNKLISKLNNEEKEIISLKILSDLSFEQISRLLNKPVGTIKWKYYKSINTLKILLSNFVIAFITVFTGLKILINRKNNNVSKQEMMQNDDAMKKEENNNFQQDEYYENEFEEYGQQELLQQAEDQENTNCNSTCVFGISTIFLIVITIFSIFFTKHQLKRIKKASK